MTILPCASGVVGTVWKTPHWIMLHIRSRRHHPARLSMKRAVQIKRYRKWCCVHEVIHRGAMSIVTTLHITLTALSQTLAVLQSLCPYSLLARIVVWSPSIASPSLSTDLQSTLLYHPLYRPLFTVCPYRFDLFWLRLKSSENRSYTYRKAQKNRDEIKTIDNN